MSHREARGLVERVVKDRLAVDLSSQEYDRLADAVLRLRAAARKLRTADDSPSGMAIRARERDAMQRALTEIQTISGLQASDLGEAFEGDGRRP